MKDLILLTPTNVIGVGAVKVLESNLVKVSLYGEDAHGFIADALPADQFEINHHREFNSYISDFTSDLKISRLHLEKKMCVPENELVEQIKIIDTLSRCSDFVFVEAVELHEWSCLLLRDDYHPPKNNVFWLVPGIVSGHNETVITWHHWLNVMQQLYRPLAELLGKIDTTNKKPLWFDALLGRPSAPRQFIVNQIKRNNIDANVIKSIRNTQLSGAHQDSEIIWEPGCNVVIPRDESEPWYSILYANVEFHGQRMTFSQTLPLSVYTQTAYSVLSETGYSNSVIMLTEKSAKMMLASRIFVSFGSKGHLEHLRSIGFRTFNSVFDESYDLIDNDRDRWKSAWNTLTWLCQQDQQSISTQSQEILQHNYNHMLSTNWRQPVVESIKRKLKI